MNTPLGIFEQMQAAIQNMQQGMLELRQEVTELKAALPEYVDEQEAQRLTGASGKTLYRERQNPSSLIVWKKDRGVRYLRSSLLLYNERHTIRRQPATLTHT